MVRFGASGTRLRVQIGHSFAGTDAVRTPSASRLDGGQTTQAGAGQRIVGRVDDDAAMVVGLGVAFRVGVGVDQVDGAVLGDARARLPQLGFRHRQHDAEVVRIVETLRHINTHVVTSRVGKLSIISYAVPVRSFMIIK